MLTSSRITGVTALTSSAFLSLRCLHAAELQILEILNVFFFQWID